MNFNELFQKMRELDQPVTEEPNEGNAFSGALDAAKDAGKDEFEVDGKTFQVKEDDVEECGMGPMPSMNQEQQDTVTMNLSMNGSGSGGIRDLLDILKNIDGEDGGEEQLGKLMGKMGKEPIIGDADMPMDEYANSPDEAYGTVGDVTPTGNDLHSKGAEAEKVNGGGNPFGVDEDLVNRLASMYESIKLRESNGEQIDEFGVNLTQPRTSWAHKGPAEFDDKANADAMSAKYNALIKNTQQELAKEKANPRGSPNHIKYLEDQIKGLEKEKIHNMFVAMPDDATNALRKQAIANNELTPGQWLQKATQYFKGKITGQPQPGVEYDRVDTSKQLKPGWKTPTPYKPEAVPMKESNEIIKLSKMLNG